MVTGRTPSKIPLNKELDAQVRLNSWTYNQAGIEAVRQETRRAARRAVRNDVDRGRFQETTFAQLKRYGPQARLDASGVRDVDDLALGFEPNGGPKIAVALGELILEYDPAIADATTEAALRRLREDNLEFIEKKKAEFDARVAAAEERSKATATERDEKQEAYRAFRKDAPSAWQLRGWIAMFLVLAVAEVLSFYLGLASNVFGVNPSAKSLIAGATALKAWGAFSVSNGLFVFVTMLGELLLRIGGGRLWDPKDMEANLRRIGIVALLLFLSLFISLKREVIGFEDAAAAAAAAPTVGGGSTWTTVLLLVFVTAAMPVAAAQVLRRVRELATGRRELAKIEEDADEAEDRATAAAKELEDAKGRREGLDQEGVRAKKDQEAAIKERQDDTMRSAEGWTAFVRECVSVLERAEEEFNIAAARWNRFRRSWIGRIVLWMFGGLL
jgi:HAMP domain-containing protein